ncbi:MAG: hypothetical protein ACE5OR_17775, partial [bacterium]
MLSRLYLSFKDKLSAQEVQPKGECKMEELSKKLTGAVFVVMVFATALCCSTISFADHSNTANTEQWSILSCSFTILTPAAGETLACGGYDVITWSPVDTDCGTWLKFEVYKGGVYYATIDPTGQNDGDYGWSIPDTMAP